MPNNQTDSVETRPAIQVNVIDSNGNVIAAEIMEYEVADFLQFRVDPAIASGCTVVYLQNP